MSSNFEEETINSLIKDIKNNNLNEDNSIVSKKRCCAGVKIDTKKHTFNKLKPTDGSLDQKVCLIEEKKNNISKTVAYSQCSKTVTDGGKFCHIHSRMLLLNGKNLKEFNEIIPENSSKEKREWLDDINHSFFKNMGKRGAKKKNNKNYYIFDQSDNPILMALNHKNANFYFSLYEFAKNLIDGGVNTKYNELRPDIKKNNNINDLINSIQSDDYETVLSSEDNISIDSQNESEYIPIYSNDNQEFYLDKNNYEVYKPIENTDLSECNTDETPIVYIGFLKETTEKYNLIKYENKYYTIVREEIIKKRGAIYLSLYNNIIFDKEMNDIGNLTKISDKKYEYQFYDEI
jgi:hypothetical protein